MATIAMELMVNKKVAAVVRCGRVFVIIIHVENRKCLRFPNNSAFESFNIKCV